MSEAPITHTPEPWLLKKIATNTLAIVHPITDERGVVQDELTIAEFEAGRDLEPEDYADFYLLREAPVLLRYLKSAAKEIGDHAHVAEREDSPRRDKPCSRCQFEKEITASIARAEGRA